MFYFRAKYFQAQYFSTGFIDPPSVTSASEIIIFSRRRRSR